MRYTATSTLLIHVRTENAKWSGSSWFSSREFTNSSSVAGLSYGNRAASISDSGTTTARIMTSRYLRSLLTLYVA